MLISEIKVAVSKAGFILSNQSYLKIFDWPEKIQPSKKPLLFGLVNRVIYWLWFPLTPIKKPPS